MAEQGAGKLHLETVMVGRRDYGAAYRLMFREALRSPFMRRRVFRRAFLVGFFSVLAGCAAPNLFWIVQALLRGRSAWPQLNSAVHWLPVYFGAALAFALLYLGWRIAHLAWLLRGVRRATERSVNEPQELQLAWNEARFGLIVGERLHAWPIRDLQAGDSNATHLFAVIPSSGNLIPIPRSRIDAAAADRLRQAMAAAQVTNLWSYLERDMFLTVKELQPRGVTEIFS